MSNIQPVEGYKYSLDKDKKVISQKSLGKRKIKALVLMNLSNSLLVASPKEEGTYSFKAVQTYDNKDKVKWTGKANSEHPAPTLEVKKCKC